MKKMNIVLAGALSLLATQTMAANCPNYNLDETYQANDQINYEGTLYQAEREVPKNTSPNSAWFWTTIETCSSGLATNVVKRPQRFFAEVTTNSLSVGAFSTSALKMTPSSLSIFNDGEGGFQRTNIKANEVVIRSGSSFGEAKTALTQNGIDVTTISLGSVIYSTSVNSNEISTPALLIDGVDQATLNAQLLQRITALENALADALALK